MNHLLGNCSRRHLILFLIIFRENIGIACEYDSHDASLIFSKNLAGDSHGMPNLIFPGKYRKIKMASVAAEALLKVHVNRTGNIYQ